MVSPKLENRNLQLSGIAEELYPKSSQVELMSLDVEGYGKACRTMNIEPLVVCQKGGSIFREVIIKFSVPEHSIPLNELRFTKSVQTAIERLRARKGEAFGGTNFVDEARSETKPCNGMEEVTVTFRQSN